MIKLLSAGTVVELSKTAQSLPVTDLAAAVTAASWDDISCAVEGITTEANEREQIETTSICETVSKTYMDGLSDADSASSTGFFNPASDEGIALQKAADNRGTYILRVTFLNGATWSRLARVQPFGFDVGVGQVIKTSINFKLDGKPVTTPATVV